LVAGLRSGPEVLYNLLRARQQDRQSTRPELQRAILSIRRRHPTYAAPVTRSCLIGATSSRAELKALGV
jgi:hypothetical protein